MQTQSLQLYIEDQQVELHDDESVNLTQSIQNVRDIKKIFSDFTQTFNVPASKVNNKIFKHFHNFNIDGFDARTKKDAVLNLNYKPFKKGKVKFEGVQMNNNKPVNYRLTFFGDTITMKDLFGEDKLDALEALQNLQIEYTSTSISGYMDTPLNLTRMGQSFPEAVLVPLITHTERLYYKSGEDTAGTGNLHVGSNVKGVKNEQLKPALRVYYIIKAIEKQYNLEFSTDFFNTTNEPFYNLYMWMHRRKGNIVEDADNATKELTIDNFGDFNFQGNTDIFAPQSNVGFKNDTTGRTAQRSFIALEVTTGSSSKYKLIIRKNGTTFFTSDELTGSQDVTTINGDVGIDNGTDFYTFHFETVSSQAATFNLVVTIRERFKHGVFGSMRNRYMTMEGEVTTSTNIEFNLAREIPEIKVIDFMTGLFQMFNLTAQKLDRDGDTVKTGKFIKVQTLDNFYSSSTQSYDITEFLDKTTSEVNAIMPYNQINLKYEGLQTTFAAKHFETENVEWGTLNYEQETHQDLGQGSYEIKLPFEHMKFERLYNDTGGAATTIQWGWSANLDLESHVGKPLLFYPYKVTSGDAISVQLATDSQVSKTTYYIPSNQVNPKDTTLASPTINFNAELGEYTNQPFKNTLFEVYYKKYIVDTFNKNRRLSKFKAYLPISIISNLKLQDIIVVFTNSYKINTISTNFETGLSNLELINVVSEVILKVDDSDGAKTIDRSPVSIDSMNVTIDNDVLLI